MSKMITISEAGKDVADSLTEFVRKQPDYNSNQSKWHIWEAFGSEEKRRLFRETTIQIEGFIAHDRMRDVGLNLSNNERYPKVATIRRDGLSLVIDVYVKNLAEPIKEIIRREGQPSSIIDEVRTKEKGFAFNRTLRK